MRPEPPPPSEVSAPFWEATRDGRLVVQWCRPCDEAVFFPRVVCPRCLRDDLEWRPSAGTGTVYAFTVEHRPQDPRLADRAPYVVALIDVDEGWRMLTNIVGTDPHAVAVGARVEVAWEPLSDGRQLPVFTPAGRTDA
jgi:uncharacterized OB-fold protein